MVRIRSNNGTKPSICSLSQLLIYVFLSTTSYYIGYITSLSNTSSTSTSTSSSTLTNNHDNPQSLEQQYINLKVNYQKEQEENKSLYVQLQTKEGQIAQAIQENVEQGNKLKKEKEELTAEVHKLQMQLMNGEEMLQSQNQNNGEEDNTTTNNATPLPRFAKTSFFAGMAYTPKEKFMKTYDFGSPIDSPFTSDVLMLYTPKSIPKGITEVQKLSITTSNTSKDIPKLEDPTQATNNCNIMHVVTLPLDEKNKNTCMAIVQNYNNQLTQKWMRPHPNNPKSKLEIATRGQTEKSRVFRPPESHHIVKHWDTLRTYFNNIDDVLKELKPIAESVAKDNTIIVLTCNMGQSELLINFVCNAKAKGLEVGNILVFPTDEETKELAEGLGLTTFHDERNFGKLPKGEAKSYGDRNFSAMMFAKVVCVQLINHLGYDLLFQDVDVVWYKNPLEYFHDTTNPYHDFDMYFQDDGAHSARYAPYSANSGFYYVRNNEKTRYLFTSLLYHADMIVQSNSHQQALIQLLANHASLFGLKVKVLDREMEEFPGGWHYHRRKDLMRGIMSEKIVPEIFHMSWTQNKDNKLKFYQQMGQWYVNDNCIGATRDKILGVAGEGSDAVITTSEDVLFEPCCLAEPNIVCHYRDKPSKIPCKDKDPIDAGRPSFW